MCQEKKIKYYPVRRDSREAHGQRKLPFGQCYMVQCHRIYLGMYTDRVRQHQGNIRAYQAVLLMPVGIKLTCKHLFAPGNALTVSLHKTLHARFCRVGQYVLGLTCFQTKKRWQVQRWKQQRGYGRKKERRETDLFPPCRLHLKLSRSATFQSIYIPQRCCLWNGHRLLVSAVERAVNLVEVGQTGVVQICGLQCPENLQKT